MVSEEIIQALADFTARLEHANDAFENYDFGDMLIEDVGGWGFDNTNTWSRAFTVAVPGDGFVLLDFVVRFEPGSAEVVDAYVASERSSH